MRSRVDNLRTTRGIVGGWIVESQRTRHESVKNFIVLPHVLHKMCTGVLDGCGQFHRSYMGFVHIFHTTNNNHHLLTKTYELFAQKGGHLV